MAKKITTPKRAVKKTPAPKPPKRKPMTETEAMAPVPCSDPGEKKCKKRAQIKIKSAAVCESCVPIEMSKHKKVKISPIPGAPDAQKIMERLIFAMR